jgi:Hemolysin coregulated protein Hcp (TssD)
MPAVGVNAQATIDGKQYDVVDFSYGFYQDTDERGSPTGATRGHLLRLSVVITENTETAILYDWAFNADRQLSGFIEFILQNGGGVARKIEFEDAYCVGLSDKFMSTSDISTSRMFQVFYVPETPRFRPTFRGATFSEYGENGLRFDLIISASKIKIGQVEVTCF